MTKLNKDGTLKYNHNGTMSVLEQTIAMLEKKKKKAMRVIQESDILINELKKKLKK